MKKCYKIKNLFGSYIYDTISQEEKAEVEEHIKTCHKCAEDLRTQQKTLEIIKIPQSTNYDASPLDEDRFMWNVYRKVALESMKHKSRQLALRKFVFQPAIATAAIVLIVAFVVTRFDNVESSKYDFAPIASNMTTPLPKIEEAKVIEQDIASREPLVKDDIARPIKKPAVSVSVSAKKQKETRQSIPNFLLTEAKMTNSRDWLMNADLINYSLGEPRKALSKYQMIIDHYPDTEAAKEAQKRINTILDSEFVNKGEAVTLEVESNSGI